MNNIDVLIKEKKFFIKFYHNEVQIKSGVEWFSYNQPLSFYAQDCSIPVEQVKIKMKEYLPNSNPNNVKGGWIFYKLPEMKKSIKSQYKFFYDIINCVGVLIEENNILLHYIKGIE